MGEKRARDHYKAIHDLIGAEDLRFLKAFVDATHAFVDFEDLSEDEQQGLGLLTDILEPEGIDENGSNN